FILIIGNSQSLLQSVAMEKENRMIEIMLSIIDSKTLVRGKILGLMGSGITQLVIWLVLGTIGLVVLNSTKLASLNLNIDLGSITILSVVLSLFLAFCGFLTIASIMVGVGAMGKNYRDSQSLSSIFILISVFPIYFISILISDPNSILAIIFSYFPLTSPMILLLRSAFGQLKTVELIIGVLLTLLYTIIAFYLAPKLFDLGSLMYSRRPTMKEIVKTILPIG
ncbi:ABC transporter permease, partial [Candidatus Dojkabacteria bacterium]|nr:ABC transporter permease [Candidatus Dojkabacteria bacterium]